MAESYLGLQVMTRLPLTGEILQLDEPEIVSIASVWERRAGRFSKAWKVHPFYSILNHI